MAKPHTRGQYPRGPFIEGFDSYAEEYARWRKANLVKGLLGIFEVPGERYYSSTLEELVAHAGSPSAEVLYYGIEVDNSEAGVNQKSTSTGCAVAVRDHYSKVRPIVFIREDVRTQDGESQSDAEMAAATKLMVLLHELGHAEDISRSINYNHKTLEVDIVEAEVYAHSFAASIAQRTGYWFLLGSYLDAIEKARSSSDESVQRPAIIFCERHDMAAIRDACSLDWSTDEKIARHLKQSGRLKDVLRAKRRSE